MIPDTPLIHMLVAIKSACIPISPRTDEDVEVGRALDMIKPIPFDAATRAWATTLPPGVPGEGYSGWAQGCSWYDPEAEAAWPGDALFDAIWAVLPTIDQRAARAYLMEQAARTGLTWFEWWAAAREHNQERPRLSPEESLARDNASRAYRGLPTLEEEYESNRCEAMTLEADAQRAIGDKSVAWHWGYIAAGSLVTRGALQGLRYARYLAACDAERKAPKGEQREAARLERERLSREHTKGQLA
jgi:hypothetical protein